MKQLTGKGMCVKITIMHKMTGMMKINNSTTSAVKTLLLQS